MMNAVARDLTPPGHGTLILEALTDLWVNIVVPAANHPFAGTASESVQALLNVEGDSHESKSDHPLCAGRDDDFRAVFSLTLAMLEKTFENYPNAVPSPDLDEVAVLITEGTMGLEVAFGHG